jgi:hypothetical protein
MPDPVIASSPALPENLYSAKELLERAKNLFKSSEDMASKVTQKPTTAMDGNSFIANENTYQMKENFNSTVPAFVVKIVPYFSLRII